MLPQFPTSRNPTVLGQSRGGLCLQASGVQPHSTGGSPGSWGAPIQELPSGQETNRVMGPHGGEATAWPPHNGTELCKQQHNPKKRDGLDILVSLRAPPPNRPPFLPLLCDGTLSHRAGRWLGYQPHSSQGLHQRIRDTAGYRQESQVLGQSRHPRS